GGWGGEGGGWRVATSHTEGVLSPEAVRPCRPSGLKKAHATGPPCDIGPTTACPVLASQTYTVPSALAVTTRCPARSKEPQQTDAWCFVNWLTRPPEPASPTQA